ncbi:MAG: hypothetical protein AABW93_03225 [Nanoarchaeota archaeon]
MTIRYKDIRKNLDDVFTRMNSDGLEIGTVVNLGTGTEQLGLYFSDRFGCKKTQLPSVIRKGRNRKLAHILNSSYPYFPEFALKLLSYGYRRLYSGSERIIPDISLKGMLSDTGLPVLLVDDNCFTGNSLNLWKTRIENETKIRVKTFAITVTGNFRPDYFCFEGWHSFEWRPIGI